MKSPAKKKTQLKPKKAAARVARKAGVQPVKTVKATKKKAAPSKTPKPAAKAKVRKPSVSAHDAKEIEKRLTAVLPEPRPELDHVDAWQLLIATILSAQSTDKMVNKTTPALFARYGTPAALAAADQEDVETLVKSTGFFRNKAKSIRAASAAVAERFGGEVPRTMEEMITLPGVARKTANVVLGTAYRIASGITVDTHVGRVSRRLGLSHHEDPVEVERDLCSLFPESSWIDMGHRLVLHGRYLCVAKKPRCVDCPINELCSAREAEPWHTWQARAEHEHRLFKVRAEQV